MDVEDHEEGPEAGCRQMKETRRGDAPRSPSLIARSNRRPHHRYDDLPVLCCLLQGPRHCCWTIISTSFTFRTTVEYGVQSNWADERTQISPPMGDDNGSRRPSTSMQMWRGGGCNCTLSAVRNPNTQHLLLLQSDSPYTTMDTSIVA